MELKKALILLTILNEPLEFIKVHYCVANLFDSSIDIVFSENSILQINLKR